MDLLRACGWQINGKVAAVLKPSCRPDGSYTPEQCDKSTGPCWCVDKNGNELAGTRVSGRSTCTSQCKCYTYSFSFHITNITIFCIEDLVQPHRSCDMRIMTIILMVAASEPFKWRNLNYWSRRCGRGLWVCSTWYQFLLTKRWWFIFVSWWDKMPKRIQRRPIGTQCKVTCLW